MKERSSGRASSERSAPSGPYNLELAETPAADGFPASNVDAAYSALKAAILNHSLEAGAELSQVQLATQFKMSRAPLREALRLLERDGLIEPRPRRSVRVAPVSFDDLDQLYALRIANEALAVRLTVPRMTEADIDELRSSLVLLENRSADADWPQWFLEHRRFHIALYRGAGNRMLRMVGDMFDHGQRYREFYRLGNEDLAPAISAVEHAEIVEACARREAEAASVLMARHLARTALTIFASIAPERSSTLVHEAVRFVTQGAETE